MAVLCLWVGTCKWIKGLWSLAEWPGGDNMRSVLEIRKLHSSYCHHQAEEKYSMIPQTSQALLIVYHGYTSVAPKGNMTSTTFPVQILGNTYLAPWVSLTRRKDINDINFFLALSPIGDAFRNRLRMFPSLINCCTIDWFQAWPTDALELVANKFLEDVELDDNIRKE